MADLPTTEELQTLPRWARVAFAARCARRVQPLFKATWRNAPEEHLRAIDAAITLAERAAAAPLAKNNAEIAAAADLAGDANLACGIAAGAAADDAASAAAYAAAAAAANNDAEIATAAGCAASTAGHACNVLTFAQSTVYPARTNAMRFDFELLKVTAAVDDWSDETPVPPEFFGPLWPSGEPQGWPEAESEEGPTAIQLEFTIPADVDKVQADRLIGEIILAANELHHAFGGSGLTIADDIKVYESAPVPEPEPVGGPA